MKKNLLKSILLILLLTLLSFIVFKNRKTYQILANQLSDKFKKQEFKSLNEKYHIKPDKRLLNTIKYIYEFYGESVKLNIKYINNQWEINKKYKVSEYPDFKEFINIYQLILKGKPQLLNSEVKDYSRIKNKINSFNPKIILKTLEEIGKQWKKNKSSKLLKLALISYINLLVMHNDRLNLTDNLYSKAISILAILKFKTNENIIEEEAILAYLSGYSNYAENILKEKDDFIYNIVTENLRKLKTITRTSNIQKVMYINLLAKNMLEEEVLELSQKYFPKNYLLAANFIFRLDGFRESQKFSELLPYLLILNMNNKNTPDDYKSFIKNNLNKNPYKLISEKLNSTKLPTSLFLDNKTYITYFSSLAYNALYENFTFYINKLASYDISSLINTLKTSNLELSQEFIDYFKLLKSIKTGKIKSIKNITDFNYLNAAFFINASQKYTSISTYGSLRGVKIFKKGINLVDTRTTDKIFMQKLLRYSILDLIYWEKLVASIINTDKYQNGYYRLFYAFAQNNMNKFYMLLQDDTVSALDKGSALYVFGDNIKNKKRITQIFDKIINDTNLRWNILSNFTEFLQKANENDKAIHYLKIALMNNNNKFGMTQVQIKTAIARKYFHKKEYKKALKIVEPLVNSYQAGAMQRTIEILIKLKKYKKAERIAQKLITRYPYLLWARATFAKIYWSKREYKKAVKVLKSYPSKIDNMKWHYTIAPEFSDIFKGKPKEEALKAFMALKAEGSSVLDLGTLANNISYEYKRHDIAFLMSTKISFSGYGRFDSLLTSYNYLKKWKSKKIAFKWLYPQIPKNLYDWVALLSFGSKEYDLLWKFKIPQNVKLKAPEGIWLCRASYFVISGNTKHKKELIDYYKKTPNNYYDRIGAYLMGLRTEKEIISLIDTEKKKCEIGYYIAIKAESEKKYKKAAKWYQISILTGLSKNGEYRWAYNRLFNLKHTLKTFENAIKQTRY